MATTLVVERIDILEGPNLDELLRMLKFAAARDGLPNLFVSFDSVVFFGSNAEELHELGEGLDGQVVGVRYVGNDARSATRDDFVITVKALGGLFEGHYDTHSRKGSLGAVR